MNARTITFVAALLLTHGALAQQAHDEHAGHAGHGGVSVTPVPPLTDADRAAAAAPVDMHAMHGGGIHSFLLFNRLEAWRDNGETGLGWQASGWLGTDLSRLWLRTEGEHVAGDMEAADLELLYGRSISTWWDVVGGVRQEFAPGSDRSWAAIGLQGLAPQRFEVRATAYVGEGGRTAARFEAEYKLLLTNRLILQPVVEAALHGKDDPARGIGSGLTSIEAGLRLRYEFTRRFAPYVGISRDRAFGDTADLRRAAGGAAGDTRVVAGVRTWF